MDEKKEPAVDLQAVIGHVFRSTASFEGEAYLHGLVRSLSDALGMKVAMIAEFDLVEDDLVHVRHIWEGNGYATEFAFRFPDTVFEELIESDFVCHEKGVQQKYPNDELLKHYKAESFISVPLLHNEKRIGFIALIDTKECLRDEDGRAMLHILATRIVLEIERDRREEELRVSEKKFRDFANLMPLVVYEMDTSGFISYTNAHGLELSGLIQQDFIEGVHILDLFDIDQRDRVESNIQSLLSNTTLGPNEYTLRRRDGTKRHIKVVSQPIMSDGIVVGIRGVVVDMTMEKRAIELEEIVESAQKRAENAEDRLNSAIIAANSLNSTLEKLLSHTGDQPALASQVRSAHDSLTLLISELVDPVD